MKSAVLVNDTSLVYHYWCQLVSNNIEKWLKENNIQLHKKYFFTENWVTKKLLNYIGDNNIDYVIINGEGSIHHNRPLANELISLWYKVKQKYKNIKVVLLNSTIQEMDDKIELLKFFDLINVRESYSQKYLQKNTIESFLTPDISIYGQAINNPDKDDSIVVWWSVIPSKMKDNIAFAKNNQLTFRDIFYIPKGSNKNPYNVAIKLIYLIIKKINYIFSSSLLLKSSYKEISDLSNKSILISWRFHDIYISILSWVDFYIISSNSHKIQWTLTDIWLENKIYSNISDIKLDKLGYTREEKTKVAHFYLQGQKQIKQLFNKITSL